MWKTKAAELNLNEDTIDKLEPIINDLLSATIEQERSIQDNNVTCPYCMKQDNKLGAVAGVHGEFISSVTCLCGKKFRVFGHRTVIIDKVEGET